MICRDCERTYQVVKPSLSFAQYAPALAVVLGIVAEVAIFAAFIVGWASPAVLLFGGIAALAPVFVGVSALPITGPGIATTLRAFVRRNLIGWPVFGYTEHGEVHEHLFAPMGVAYIQVRVGGVFRQCRIVDWAGNILPWTVKCSNGFVGPVTIRHRTTGETFTSSAPARILAKALAVAKAEAAKAKRSYEKPTITPVADEANEAASAAA